MVRVQLTGNYDFETAAGPRPYMVAVQRELTSHAGLDTMDRCLIVRGDADAEFSLTLREGVSYRFGHVRLGSGAFCFVCFAAKAVW